MKGKQPARTKTPRVRALHEPRQLERARQWQTERMYALADRIDKGEVGEASWAEIDAIFEQAAARDRRSSPGSASPEEGFSPDLSW